jgi:hypothetical protein
MALPTNITATPNQSDVGDLPRTVTITGTDIFERPSYTVRELLTQVAPDVLAASWGAGATKTDGIIGDAAVFIGTSTSYILLPSSLGALFTDYFGFSIWFKTTDGGRNPLFSGRQNSPTAEDLAIYLNNTSGISVDLTASSKTLKKIVSTPAATNFADGLWHNVYVSIDLSNPANEITLIVDGDDTRVNVVTSNDNISAIPTLNQEVVLGWQGSPLSRLNGTLCNAYWSNDVAFDGQYLKYANLPTIEVV